MNVIFEHDRCLTKNTSAIIELELERPVCIELFDDFKDLGRFMLRYAGTTIAAGLVKQVSRSAALIVFLSYPCVDFRK